MHRAIVHRSTTGAPCGALYESPGRLTERKGRDVRRVFVGAAVGAVVLVVAAVAVAQIINGVPNANPRSGSPANIVANGFALQRVVNGNDTLENPAGIFARYGYLDDSTIQRDHHRPRPSPTRTPTWSPGAARAARRPATTTATAS